MRLVRVIRFSWFSGPLDSLGVLLGVLGTHGRRVFNSLMCALRIRKITLTARTLKHKRKPPPPPTAEHGSIVVLASRVHRDFGHADAASVPNHDT